MRKQLSVIVPIFNVENYLRECLSSVYQLRDVDLEVILINDKSTDNSHLIIEEFRRKYPAQTTVVNNEKNLGLGLVRNIGIQNACGAYIMFVDSDDYIDAASIQALYSKTVELDLDIGIGCAKTFWGELSREFISLSIPSSIVNSGICNGKDLLRKSFSHGYCRVECWNKLYKAEFLSSQSISFPTNVIYEDVSFTFCAYFKAKKVCVIDVNSYFYRQRPGSVMTLTPSKNKEIGRLNVIDDLLELFAEHNFQGREFDDYLVYQLYRHSVVTGNVKSAYLNKLISRKKCSMKGFIKLLLLKCRLYKYIEIH